MVIMLAFKCDKTNLSSAEVYSFLFLYFTIVKKERKLNRTRLECPLVLNSAALLTLKLSIVFLVWRNRNR